MKTSLMVVLAFLTFAGCKSTQDTDSADLESSKSRSVRRNYAPGTLVNVSKRSIDTAAVTDLEIYIQCDFQDGGYQSNEFKFLPNSVTPKILNDFRKLIKDSKDAAGGKSPYVCLDADYSEAPCKDVNGRQVKTISKVHSFKAIAGTKDGLHCATLSQQTID